MSDIQEISAEEAVAAIERCAFTTDEGERIVHCFAGSLGADWDADGAIDAARSARRIAWIDHIFTPGMCLGMEVEVEPGEFRVRVFDTVTPEAVAS